MKPYLIKEKCVMMPEECPVIKQCEQKAVSYDKQNESFIFDLEKCNGCGKCVDICCSAAIKMI